MNSDGATLEHIWKLFCSVFAEQTSRIDAHGKDRGSGMISKATYQLNFYAWIYLDTHVKSKNKWEFCVMQTTLHFIIQVLFFFTTQITAASQHSLQMWRFPNEFSWMSRLVFLLRKTHFNKRKSYSLQVIGMQNTMTNVEVMLAPKGYIKILANTLTFNFTTWENVRVLLFFWSN